MSNCYLCDTCERATSDASSVTDGWCHDKPGHWRRLRPKLIWPDPGPEDPREVCGIYEEGAS